MNPDVVGPLFVAIGAVGQTGSYLVERQRTLKQMRKEASTRLEHLMVDRALTSAQRNLLWWAVVLAGSMLTVITTWQ